MFQKFITAILMSFTTVLLLWAVGYIWFSANILVMQPREPATKTDAIIVLTGSNGRIDEGIRLLNSGLAPRLLISGVNEHVKVEDLTNGKPAHCCITLGYTAQNTVENAKESQEWIQENKVHSVRLITSDYHMVRSRLIFLHAVGDIQIYPHPVKAKKQDLKNKDFWLGSLEEYNKTIATWIKLSMQRETA
jgi:uncharacterized SAM-binding protein YcdF (DUF218 family)